MDDLCKEDSIDSNPDGDSGNTQIKLPEGKNMLSSFLWMNVLMYNVTSRQSWY